MEKDNIENVLNNIEPEKLKIIVDSFHEYFNKKIFDELQKEKEKNKAIEIYRKDMPKDTEIVIMRKEDFDRNYKNEYVSKDKIREFRKHFIEDSKKEKIFMTQSSQINVCLIRFCEALLDS